MQPDPQMQHLEAFVIDNPQLDELEALIAEFNIFEAMGAVRQELRHSDFLGFLLNPSEKHGLDDRLLKRFLIKVLAAAETPPITPITINLTDFSKALVEREAQHIDILISDVESGIVCVIENKIFSSEHSDQLNRYKAIVERRFPDAKAIIYVFLTPDGIPPEEDDSPYIPFSYSEVADLIEQVRRTQESLLGVDVNTMMQHYVTMLRRYIVSDSDIAELCRQIYQAHKSAIDLIVEHMPDLQQELSDYLCSLIRNNSDFILWDDKKAYIKFIHQEWQDVSEFNRGTNKAWAKTNYNLSFEFNNRADSLSLRLRLVDVSDNDAHIREHIHQVAYQNRELFMGIRPKLAPERANLYSVKVLRVSDYEDASLEDLKDLIEPKWQNFVSNVLPQMHTILMGIEFPSEGESVG